MDGLGAGAYTSSLLGHFVGWSTRSEPDHEELDFARLIRILETGCLSSNAADNSNYKCIDGYFGSRINRNAIFTKGDLFGQQCVCFCDIPGKGLGIHVSKYGKFGLGFDKRYLIPKGATPVFYVATDSLAISGMARGEYFDTRIADYFAVKDFVEGSRSELVKHEATRQILLRFERVCSFLELTVLGLLKPFDSQLTDSDPSNVYMEREWRLLGDVSFHRQDVAAVYAPADFVPRLQERFPDLAGRVSIL